MAYLASEEFSPSWYARTMLLPVMLHKKGDSRKDEDNDPNNNIRVNDVYGLSMYKPLIKDAIRVVLRDHGYNGEGSFKSPQDSYEFISDDHFVKKVKEDVWMNCRMEAYRTCLDRVISGDFPHIPRLDMDAKSKEDCEFLLKTMHGGGARIDEIFKTGLLSQVAYDRYNITGSWETSYLDEEGTRSVTTNSELENIKKKVSVSYARPISIPEDLPNGALKGAA